MFAVPGTPVKLVADDYAPHAEVRETVVAAAEGAPALSYTIEGPFGHATGWLLAGSEWEFDKKGIDFKNNAQWNPQQDPDSSNQWTATSKKKDGQIYKYMINLRKKSNAATTLNWDPTVMN